MAASPKIKYQKKYRLRVEKSYCSLNIVLHREGVAVPDCIGLKGAAVFNTLQGAVGCIKRTKAMQQEIAKCMYSDWDKFKPLRFDGTVVTEEFLVPVPKEEPAHV